MSSVTNPFLRRRLLRDGIDPDSPYTIQRLIDGGHTVDDIWAPDDPDRPSTGVYGNILATGSGFFRGLANTLLGVADLPLALGRTVGLTERRVDPFAPSAHELVNPNFSVAGQGASFLATMLAPMGIAGLAGKTASSAARAVELANIARGTEVLANSGLRAQFLARAPDLARALKYNAIFGGGLGFVGTPGDLGQRALTGIEGSFLGATQAALGPVPGQSLFPRLARGILAGAIPGPVNVTTSLSRGEFDANSLLFGVGMGLFGTVVTPGARSIRKRAALRNRPPRIPLNAPEPNPEITTQLMQQLDAVQGPSAIGAFHEEIAPPAPSPARAPDFVPTGMPSGVPQHFGEMSIPEVAPATETAPPPDPWEALRTIERHPSDINNPYSIASIIPENFTSTEAVLRPAEVPTELPPLPELPFWESPVIRAVVEDDTILTPKKFGEIFADEFGNSFAITREELAGAASELASSLSEGGRVEVLSVLQHLHTHSGKPGADPAMSQFVRRIMGSSDLDLGQASSSVVSEKGSLQGEAYTVTKSHPTFTPEQILAQKQRKIGSSHWLLSGIEQNPAQLETDFTDILNGRAPFLLETPPTSAPISNLDDIGRIHKNIQSLHGTIRAALQLLSSPSNPYVIDESGILLLSKLKSRVDEAWDALRELRVSAQKAGRKANFNLLDFQRRLNRHVDPYRDIPPVEPENDPLLTLNRSQAEELVAKTVHQAGLAQLRRGGHYIERARLLNQLRIADEAAIEAAAKEKASSTLSGLATKYKKLRDSALELDGGMKRIIDRNGVVRSVPVKGVSQRIREVSEKINETNSRADYTPGQRAIRFAALQKSLKGLTAKRNDLLTFLENELTDIESKRQSQETFALLRTQGYRRVRNALDTVQQILDTSRSSTEAETAMANLGLEARGLATRHIGKFSMTSAMLNALTPREAFTHVATLLGSIPSQVAGSYRQKRVQLINLLATKRALDQYTQIRDNYALMLQEYGPAMPEMEWYALNDPHYYTRAAVSGGDDIAQGRLNLDAALKADSNSFEIVEDRKGMGPNMRTFYRVHDKVNDVVSPEMPSILDAAHWMDSSRWHDNNHSPDLAPYIELPTLKTAGPRFISRNPLPINPLDYATSPAPPGTLPRGQTMWNPVPWIKKLDNFLRSKGVPENHTLGAFHRLITDGEVTASAKEAFHLAKLNDLIPESIRIWMTNSPRNNTKLTAFNTDRARAVLEIVKTRTHDPNTKVRILSDEAAFATLTPQDISAATALAIDFHFQTAPMEFKTDLAQMAANQDGFFKEFFRKNGMEELVPEIPAYWMRLPKIVGAIRSASQDSGITVDAWIQNMNESGHFRPRTQLIEDPPTPDPAFANQLSDIGLDAQNLPYSEAMTSYVRSVIRHEVMREPISRFQAAVKRLSGVEQTAEQTGTPGLIGSIERNQIELLLRRSMGLTTESRSGQAAVEAINTRAYKVGRKVYKAGNYFTSGTSETSFAHKVGEELEKMGQIMGYKGATGAYQRYLDFFGSLHASQTFGFSPSVAIRDLITTQAFLVSPRFDVRDGLFVGTTKQIMAKTLIRDLRYLVESGLFPDMDQSMQKELIGGSHKFKTGAAVWDSDWWRQFGMYLYRGQDRVLRMNTALTAMRAFKAGVREYRRTGNFGDFIRRTALDTHTRGNDVGFLKELKGLIDRSGMDREAQLRYLRETINGLAFDYGTINSPKMYSNAWGRFFGRYGSWSMNAIDLLHQTATGPIRLANRLKEAGLSEAWDYSPSRGAKAGLKNAAKYGATAFAVYNLFGLCGVDASDYIPWLHNSSFSGSPGVSLAVKAQQILSGEPTLVARIAKDPARETMSFASRAFPIPAGGTIRRVASQAYPWPRDQVWKHFFRLHQHQSTDIDRIAVAVGLNPFGRPLSYYKPIFSVIAGTEQIRKLPDYLHNRVSATFPPASPGLRQEYRRRGFVQNLSNWDKTNYELWGIETE